MRRAHGVSKRLIGLPEKCGAQAEKDTRCPSFPAKPTGIGKDKDRSERPAEGAESLMGEDNEGP